MSEAPNRGRRPIPNSAATSNGLSSIPPVPTLRKAASSSNLAAGVSTAQASKVIALARDAMRNALENENQAAEAGTVDANLKPGVTVDLSRRSIDVIPDEVVDIMKDQLERLALSHNQLTTVPSRFSECTSLRYLNIRANSISEFPMSQNNAVRRPGALPLTLGNVNERVRSNSETHLRERSESRNRRMGIVSKKPDLGTLDETQANNRFSHYRGLSHGSAMQGAPIGPKEPPTPTENFPQRPYYVRRLSILPERRRESKVYDPVIEAAKGILYSVFQIHPMIQMLMGLTNDGSAEKSRLERIVYNTDLHVQEVEGEIQRHDLALGEADEQTGRENENVHRACQTLVGAYGHVCTILADNIDTFVDNGDPRYIRTLVMAIYSCIMELRATLSSMAAESCQSRKASVADTTVSNYTLKPPAREPAATPTVHRPGITRSRNGTLVHNPANLRVATNMPVPPPMLSSGYSDALASATPRSGESFASAISRDVRSDTSEEDAQFDKIFLSLQKSADIMSSTLPNFHIQLNGRLRNAIQRGVHSGLVHEWKTLISVCYSTMQQTEVMRGRLSAIKLKEPGIRSQPSFWNLCSNFLRSWMRLGDEIKSAANNNVPLPADMRRRLKPIQQSIKETTTTIVNSPWHHLLGPLEPSAPNGHSYNDSGPLSPTGVSITPQSAALGPAMQAMVPKTPSSSNTSFAAAFQGNVFDRADALMANPGISMTRPGFPRKGHSNLSSFSSVSSLSSEGGMSPGPGLGLKYNAGRSAF
ncbi:Leucine-rich repeat-containing protein-like protein [Emericellopsis cladophorae]|uniref:Leucine-rich repeat-containing protein-like protein n=1 Tax=Emericellopsis cladophorae TaxID=2686198 RepID=A0A9P9Y1E6_9HYPO|nr:Leucine-rich repeat-containing protein-like protein [Emericellopsis cladophorae]KAI6781813.1 Leucine-rich repeat-containing protein-like protein [Emericellopsis cladophorae]